jgi:capsular polysaccharide biosynthesis protein
MDDLTKRRKEALEGDDISKEIERILQAVRRAPMYWYVTAAVGIIGSGAAAGAFLQIPPKYESETVIVYRQGIRAGDEAIQRDDLRNLSGTVKETVLSTAVLLPIVKDYNLYKDLWDGEDFADAIANAREAVVFEKRTEDTFALGFTGLSPEEAKGVSERLAKGAGDELVRVIRAQAKTKYEFLEAEAKQRLDSMRVIEEKRAAFLVKHPEFAEDTQSSTAPGAIIRSAESAVTGTGTVVDKAAEKDLAGLKALADQELAKSRSVLTDKLRARDELKQKYTEKHPEVRAAADAVRVAEAEVAGKQAAADEAAAKLKTLQSGAPPVATAKESDPYLAAEAERAAPLAAKAGASPTSTAMQGADIVSAETEWAMVNREVSEAKKRFESVNEDAFLAKLKIASASAGYEGSFEVVTPAYLPTEQKSPSPKVVAGGIFVVSWVFGAVGAVALALLDDRVYLAGDLSRLLDVLGAVPRGDKPKGRLLRFLERRLAIFSRMFARLRRVLPSGRVREPSA